MLDASSVLMILVFVVGFYTAWNVGANDVANAMGTSVGSGALTIKRAVILAAIFEFLGAFLVGANVSETVRKKMFDPDLFNVLYGNEAALVLATGMISSLLAAGTWLLIATYRGWPVSTTHSIVGAVVGFGCIGVGIENVYWMKIVLITAGWLISPLLSGVIAFLLFRFISRQVFFKLNPIQEAKKLAPYLVFSVLIVLVGVACFKGFKPLWGKLGVNPFAPNILAITGLAALVLAGIGALVANKFVSKINADDTDGENPLFAVELARSLTKAAVHLRRVRNLSDDQTHEQVADILSSLHEIQESVRCKTKFGTDSKVLQKVENIFVFLQVITACFVAFAHGSNDVANAIGPMSAAYQALANGAITAKSTVPAWALALGGVGIVIGLVTWGFRVIETVGKRITELTPSRGFCAEFGAAITILLASILPFGFPVSTTHILVGAVLGVGFARGISAINLDTTRNIFISWLVTIPAGAGLSVLFYYILKSLLL